MRFIIYSVLFHPFVLKFRRTFLIPAEDQSLKVTRAKPAPWPSRPFLNKQTGSDRGSALVLLWFLPLPVLVLLQTDGWTSPQLIVELWFCQNQGLKQEWGRPSCRWRWHTWGVCCWSTCRAELQTELPVRTKQTNKKRRRNIRKHKERTAGFCLIFKKEENINK